MSSVDRSNFYIPTKWQMIAEAYGIVEAGNLLLQLPSLMKVERGKGQRIIVLPGFATNDIFTFPMRKFLENIGYKPEGWGLGNNHGDVPVLLDLMNTKVREIFRETQEKIILIGWSLGGYLARECARDNQDIIEKVITLGSPIIGGPKYTSIADVYSKQHGINIDQLEKEIDERFQIPLAIPVFSIYSKKDNVVSWEACIDPYSPKVINQEIDSTHIGLIVNADAYVFIAKFLHL